MSEEPKLSPEAEKRWQSNKPVPMKFLKMVVDELIDQMLDAEEALNSRIDMLEDQQLRYQGIHVADKQYVVGDIATFRGGLWHCNVTTKSLPGTGEDWRLMAKTPTTARRNRT